jgi:ribosome-binding ATPase YchF (GTP1/OBG family)
MATSDFLIACVGKPSAGKSSFLNAGNYCFYLEWTETIYIYTELSPPLVTDATAKVGNYPFTTIQPNHGVAYYPTICPCKQFNKIEQCQPRYGRILGAKKGISTKPTVWVEIGQCVDGMRYVPVRMLDVAGLVPGASEGRVIDIYIYV